MQVSAISSIPHGIKKFKTILQIIKPSTIHCNQCQQTLLQRKNSPSFTGYSDIVINSVSKTFKNESEIEKGFRTLFTALRQDKSILKQKISN